MITDINGKLVKSIFVAKKGRTYFGRMDIESLKPGHYIISLIMNNGKLLTRKFVKGG
jgi:hypothetical protein